MEIKMDEVEYQDRSGDNPDTRKEISFLRCQDIGPCWILYKPCSIEVVIVA